MSAPPPSRRFAVYNGQEMVSIITATSFYPPAAAPGTTGNLVFHDDGLPVAVFAAGEWDRAETAARTAVPDAPPVNLETMESE